MKSLPKAPSRRHFIRQSSCAAIGMSTLMSSLLSLKSVQALAMSNSTVAAADDYKALVCFGLGGGNDAFNMLMPREGAANDIYRATRTNLAIPSTDMLAINPVNDTSATYGLHPSMPRMQQAFNDGELAFINNVGTLVAPLTKPQVYDGSVGLPLGLFSHSDQYQQWQTGLPSERSIHGWGGRIADLIRDMNTNTDISMNISLAGSNIFQRGNEVVEFAMDPLDGAVQIIGDRPDDPFNTFDRVRTEAIESMMEQNYSDVLKQSYVDVIKTSRDVGIQVQSALDQAPTFDGIFSDNEVSDQFRMIARTIAVHEALGVRRQTFYVEFNGWDHHDEVLMAQAGMLTIVDQALAEFATALKQMDCFDAVTTFALTEFARTLTSNGNGTDHAWGGCVFAMGGPVVGNRFYGTYPSLALDGELEIGNGVLLPTTSTDEYFAELALWFGVQRSDLPLIFPNITNFYDLQSTSSPLGFLNI